MTDDTDPRPEASSLTLVSKHLENVHHELAIITAEIEELKQHGGGEN